MYAAPLPMGRRLHRPALLAAFGFVAGLSLLLFNFWPTEVEGTSLFFRIGSKGSNLSAKPSTRPIMGVSDAAPGLDTPVAENEKSIVPPAGTTNIAGRVYQTTFDRFETLSAVPIPGTDMVFGSGRLTDDRMLTFVAIVRSPDADLRGVLSTFKGTFVGPCKFTTFGDNHGQPYQPALLRCTIEGELPPLSELVPGESDHRYTVALECNGTVTAIPRTPDVGLPPSSLKKLYSDSDEEVTALTVPLVFGEVNCASIRLWLDFYTIRHQVDRILLYFGAGPLPCPDVFANYPQVSITFVPVVLAYRMHYYGQLYVAHEAWLRSVGTVDWFGQIDFDEFIVLPNHTNYTLASYASEQCKKAGKGGMSFGSHNHDWRPEQVTDFHAQAGRYWPDVATKVCTEKPHCSSGEASELCLSFRGRRKFITVPERLGFMNIHHGNPVDMYFDEHTDNAKIFHYNRFTRRDSMKTKHHC